MKNLLIAVLIAVLITYSCGMIANHWFDFTIHFNDLVLGPMESVTSITLISAVMAVIGVIVAVSVFGAFLLAIIAAVVALFIVGISVFWPMLLVIGIVIWLLKDKRRSSY